MSVSTMSRARRSDARRRLPPWAVGLSVLSGQVMASLDTAIVNVGAPQIQSDLHLTGPVLQLAVSAYVLVYAVGLVTGARLGARWGYARAFLGGTTLFTAASLACGLASGAVMLVSARAVQGAGAALMVPQVLSLLQAGFTGERRRRVLSLYGLVLAVGVAAGQILGGVLISADLLGGGWRPIFLVNLPIGLAVLACSAGRLPAGPDRASGRRRLDLVGALLLGGSILALVVPLTFGSDAGWPWWCWTLLGAAPPALTVFARYETRLATNGQQPLIDTEILAQRAVRQGLGGVFVLMACYGALLFTTALYLQYTLHDSPLRSGLTFAGYAAGFATASMTWSRLPNRWHPHLPAVAFALFSAATAALAWTVATSGWPWWATVLLAAAGVGHGAGFGALVRRTVEHTAPQHTASISGVLSTANQLAIAIGVAALGTLYLSTSPHTDSFPALSWVLSATAAATALTGLLLTASRPTRQADEQSALSAPEAR